jgi:undecaprenyl-diphosphatase
MGKTQNNIALRLVIAGVAFAVFCIAAVMVKTGNSTALDNTVDYAIYSLRGTATNAFFKVYTHMGSLSAIVLVVLVMLFVPRTRRQIGIPTALIGSVGALLFVGLKAAFARPRPDISLQLIEETNFSFPSGHSMNGVICLGAIVFYLRRAALSGDINLSRRAVNIITVLVVLQILGVAFSRIFLGVHYFTDVLGGLAIGLAYLMAATVVMDKLQSRRENAVQRIEE